MNLRVLGCSGGIGGAHTRTTAFLIDDDTLLDCGTGVGDLERDALLRIEHVFLSHSHLDHIAALPLMIDSVGADRHVPLTVYARPETIRILHSHIFNWLVWPDFTSIPDRRRPFMRFQPVHVGETVQLGTRRITALPAYHTVPALGFCLDSGQNKLVYTGDTGFSDDLIEAINAQGALRYLIAETAFPEEEHHLALVSRHLCPSTLHAMLEGLSVSPEVCITHLKPGYGERIMEQLGRKGGVTLRALRQGETLVF